MPERVFSGIQPTGDLHLGNYFGAIANWVRLQHEHACVYCIVDYHAITIEHEPAKLRAYSVQMAGDLMACGIDPAEAVLFVQSDVPEHTELAWILSSVASYGDLSRMTQFKEKCERQAFISAGLFTYPVLQAADILAYKAALVPVGEDQSQHLELSREIARRFNGRFGETFPEPRTLLTEATRLMSPADPTRKMSKSLGDDHVLGLFEDPARLARKVKSAVTDTGPAGQPGEKSPGVANLFLLLRLTAPPAVVVELEGAYAGGTLKYKALKECLTEHLLAFVAPIQERRRAIAADPGAIERALADGADRARAIARATLREARERIGVRPEARSALEHRQA
jgi:tryptophanyl-tRNA synthetase